MAATALFPDLEPLAQDDGPEPVVRIAYPEDFQKTMDYFRRVLVTGEYSARTMELAAEVVNHNAANYTAWQYRRRCLAEMHRDSTPEERAAAWRAELAFCCEMCLSNLKNYQVWFHRRACVDQLRDPSAELAFVATVLDDDSKNYHAWGHRQWVLREFDLWQGELEFTDSLLKQDLRNNSAWNQRFFVLQHTGELSDAAFLEGEVAYALAYIEKAPANQSPWNYLKGIAEKVGYERVPQLRAACEQYGGADPPCANALALLVDILQARVAAAARARPCTELVVAACAHFHARARVQAAQGDAAEATALCTRLQSVDPIRARYWKWRALNLSPAPPAVAAAAAASADAS